MAISVKVDEAAARYFRTLISERSKINDFVGLFVKDLEEGVSSEKSFQTMTIWQDFLKSSLGDISDLTVEEVSELNKVIRISRTDKCSMVTQALALQYGSVKDVLERPLYDIYSIMLPRIDAIC